MVVVIIVLAYYKYTMPLHINLFIMHVFCYPLDILLLILNCFMLLVWYFHDAFFVPLGVLKSMQTVCCYEGLTCSLLLSILCVHAIPTCA